MKLFNSIRAWVSGLFTKGKSMADEIIIGVDGVLNGVSVAAPAAVTGSALAQEGSDSQLSVSDEVVLTPGTPMTGVVSDAVLGKLHALLTVLGHDLELVWDDAVALAKKAL